MYAEYCTARYLHIRSADSAEPRSHAESSPIWPAAPHQSSPGAACMTLVRPRVAACERPIAASARGFSTRLICAM